MNKVMAIFIREYLERVRRKSFVIGLVMVPLFMVLVFLLPFWLSSVETEESNMVLVLDHSGLFKADFEAAITDTLSTGEERYLFLDRDGDGGSIDLGRIAESEYLAQLMESGVLDWYLEIPADIMSDHECIYHGMVVSNFTRMDILESTLTDLLRQKVLKDLSLDPQLLQELTSRITMRSLQYKDGESQEAGFETLYISSMVMVMILYMTILVFGTMINRSILEDKNQHITEVVLSSMSSTQFFTGKIAGIGAVGLTQYLAWLILALGSVVIFPAAAGQLGQFPALQPLTLFYFVCFYVLGFMLYGGLFAAAGAMCTTDQEAQQLMQPLVMMLVIPLVVMIYLFQNPDSTLSIVMSMIPFCSPLTMFMRINITSPPLWQILLSFGILIGSIWLTFIISGRIFRVGILMTGKKASLIEAWRWVKQS